jgi:hypothetical protein
MVADVTPNGREEEVSTIVELKIHSYKPTVNPKQSTLGEVKCG